MRFFEPTKEAKGAGGYDTAIGDAHFDDVDTNFFVQLSHTHTWHLVKSTIELTRVTSVGAKRLQLRSRLYA